MAAYLVSYDLNKEGKDYADLIAAIKRLNCGKVLFSEWLVATDSTAEQVFDYLRQFTDSNDGLLVVELTGTAKWVNLMTDSETVKKLLAA